MLHAVSNAALVVGGSMELSIVVKATLVAALGLAGAATARRVRASRRYLLLAALAPLTVVSGAPVQVHAPEPGAQAAKLRFEVASIRRNLSGPPAPGGSPTILDATTVDRLTATNASVRFLIHSAYGFPARLRDDELVGRPDWIDPHYFEAGPGPGPVDGNVTGPTSTGALRGLERERTPGRSPSEGRIRL